MQQNGALLPYLNLPATYIQNACSGCVGHQYGKAFQKHCQGWALKQNLNTTLVCLKCHTSVSEFLKINIDYEETSEVKIGSSLMFQVRRLRILC